MEKKETKTRFQKVMDWAPVASFLAIIGSFAAMAASYAVGVDTMLGQQLVLAGGAVASAGGAALGAFIINNRLQNPVYTYEDPAGEVKVTPTRNEASQRLSKTFGIAVDFDTQTVRDIKITRESTSGAGTAYLALSDSPSLGGYLTASSADSEYEVEKYCNARKFNEVSDPLINKRIEKLQEYMNKAKAAHAAKHDKAPTVRS